jgi:hypothetical protein
MRLRSSQLRNIVTQLFYVLFGLGGIGVKSLKFGNMFVLIKLK